jgi:hypothetical protein
MNCFNCELTYPKYFKINNKNYCYFCKLIYFIEQSDIYSVNIGYSTFNQNEIIKKTKGILSTENRIPHHSEIDPNSKILLVNPYIFINVLNMMNYSEKICFSNIRIFFTDDINIDNIKIQRLINTNKSIKKSNIKINKIKILSHQKQLYDKYLKSFISKNLVRSEI